MPFATSLTQERSIMKEMKTKIPEYVSQLLCLITSHLPSRLPAPSPDSADDLESQAPPSPGSPSGADFSGEISSFQSLRALLSPAPSPHIDDLEAQSSQPQPSPSNTTSESQAPPSQESPSGAREPDLEKELKKALLGLCFAAAIQIATQSKQAAESEIDNSISLLSLGTAAIFAALFTSHFIREKMQDASRGLGKVAFFLAATTFFFTIASPCPLGIKFAIWALYSISLIVIAICNFR